MGKREARTLPQGDFLTVNFKCLVGMRTGPLMASDCFLPAAIRDADAARIGCKVVAEEGGRACENERDE